MLTRTNYLGFVRLHAMWLQSATQTTANMLGRPASTWAWSGRTMYRYTGTAARAIAASEYMATMMKAGMLSQVPR